MCKDRAVSPSALREMKRDASRNGRTDTHTYAENSRHVCVRARALMDLSHSLMSGRRYDV